MTADAWHTLSDTLTSVVVILGFWISSRPEDEEHHFGHGRAEVIATIIIATLLAVVGINFLKDSIQQLIVNSAEKRELQYRWPCCICNFCCNKGRASAILDLGWKENG